MRQDAHNYKKINEKYTALNKDTRWEVHTHSGISFFHAGIQQTVGTRHTPGLKQKT